jgi:aldehyde:ferredoxin oxidoreductase
MLPARLLETGSPTGSSTLSRERLDTMIKAYYRERGWDRDGQVTMGLRNQLGLDEPSFGDSGRPRRTPERMVGKARAPG